MNNNAKRLFMCLFPICISSWWRVCSNILLNFYQVVCLLMIVLYNIIIHSRLLASLLGIYFAIFFQSVPCLFLLIALLFEEQRTLNSIYQFFFSHGLWLLIYYLKNTFAKLKVSNIVFYSIHFIVLVLAFGPKFLFELILNILRVKNEISFHFCT